MIPPLAITAAASMAPQPASSGPSRVADPTMPVRFSKAVLRRTSRLGRLAVPVVEAALQQAGLVPDPDLGLVVGTGLADLDETLGFLRGVHERGERYASPQMFQRSVHSGIAGELAILFGLTGYNLTVTQGLASGEAALWAAALAVASGRCVHCLCVAVDGVSDGLVEALAALGVDPSAAGEGAAALVISGMGSPSARPLGTLLGVDLAVAEAHLSDAPVPRGAHGARGLVQVAMALQGAPGAAFPPGVRVRA